ncbi:HTH-type transcriptional regulator [Legionella busanensis]|uniref:HTH-type transcriptional regulator n=1 Tax=Legionella busanensis TaxID=190655 RepID=A0A378KA76_9GAMM|nr:helix-turn-helix transcriptional regulator [Legionella busanensis]STX81616.1 HTH-type transcriptional regulator [Legionella busanensis]
MNNTLAKNLHALMMSQGLNTLTLSKESDIPQPTLHHLLSGKTKKPRKALLQKLAQFFDVSIPTLLKAELTNEPASSVKRFLILNWNEDTLNFSKPSEIHNEFIVGSYPKESFGFFIHNRVCHSLWPNQSLAIIAPKRKPEESQCGLIYFKKYGLILNKIFKEQGHFFIKHQTVTEDLLLLKIDLDKVKWFGQLIELRLMGQALTDYL